MARLRRTSSETEKAAEGRGRQLRDGDCAEPSIAWENRRILHVKAESFVFANDDKSRPSARLTPKAKSGVARQKPQVRLVPLKKSRLDDHALFEQPSFNSEEPLVSHLEPAASEFFKPRRKRLDHSLISTESGDISENSDSEDRLRCTFMDGQSDLSDGAGIPSPRKGSKFPRMITKLSRSTSIKDASSYSKMDISKQLEALEILDGGIQERNDTSVSEERKCPRPRASSFSDKENDGATIRFSPPRSKKPSKALLERPSTPPQTSPSRSRLQSPSKKTSRIPTPPLRPSIDAFWTAEAVNDWNDQYSPQKPLQSPRKLNLLKTSQSESPTSSPVKSPAKRSKAELESRKEFNVRKISLAESFLKELDETVTERQIASLCTSTGGVKIIWSKTLNSTAGRANWRRETTKTHGKEPSTTHKHFASIELAEKVIDDEHRLLNVIAHEFCHLANFMISGIKDQPHGRQFKVWGALCSKAFSHRGVQVTTKHSYEIEYKYIWRCTDEGCGIEYKRHSKSVDPTKHRCGQCKSNLIQIKPVPRKLASTNATTTSTICARGDATPVTGYAAFVKLHFAALKKEMAGASHKEVMEALGKKYRTEKAAASSSDAVTNLSKALADVKLSESQQIITLE